MDPLLSRINPRAGKILQCLDIHIFKVTDLGKLRPERDVERQGDLQGSLNI
jgi:hypothetical protein